MALDTAEKRRSVATIGFRFAGPGVTPNADNDNEWRQQAGWGYSGITPQESVPEPEAEVSGGASYLTQEEYEAALERYRKLDNARKRIRRKEKDKWLRIRGKMVEAINPSEVMDTPPDGDKGQARVTTPSGATPEPSRPLPQAFAPDPRLEAIHSELAKLKKQLADHRRARAEQDDEEAVLFLLAA